MVMDFCMLPILMMDSIILIFLGFFYLQPASCQNTGVLQHFTLMYICKRNVYSNMLVHIKK